MSLLIGMTQKYVLLFYLNIIPELYILAITQNPWAIQFIPKQLITEEIIILCITKNIQIIKWIKNNIDLSINIRDISDFYMKLFKINPNILQYIPGNIILNKHNQHIYFTYILFWFIYFITYIILLILQMYYPQQIIYIYGLYACGISMVSIYIFIGIYLLTLPYL